VRVVAALLLVLATGCDPVTTRSRPAFDAGDLGRCSTGGHVDGPEAGDFLSEPGAWYAVPEPGTYTPLGGDAGVADRLPHPLVEVDVHDSIERAIGTALDAGATVSVHVRDDLGRVPYAAFALAVKGDAFAFLGDCQYRMLTAPMRERLGADAAARLAAVVGKPSADVREVVRLRSPLLPPTEARLAGLPGGIPDSYRKGWLRVETPDDWVGPYAICAGVAAGWNECVDLATRESAARRVPMWFDPAGNLYIGLYETPPDYDDPLDVVLHARMPGLLAKFRLDPERDVVELRVGWEQALPFDAVLERRATAQMGVTWKLVDAS
jgi:hypothetical protein